MSTRLSLIIPVYNADDFINDSMTVITKWVKDIDYSVEVILVNDGSSDNSKSKII